MLRFSTAIAEIDVLSKRWYHPTFMDILDWPKVFFLRKMGKTIKNLIPWQGASVSLDVQNHWCISSSSCSIIYNFSL